MSLLAEFDSRLARLSLHSRLWAVVASLAMPMLAAALLAGFVHLYAVHAWRAYSGQEQYAVQLAHKAGADLRLLDAPATRAAALLALRAQMRDVAGLSGESSVRRAAQAVTASSYEYEEKAKAGAAPQAANTLAPLLDTLSTRAADASERARERASQLALTALVAMFLLPALATGAGILVARRFTHSIDGTLRDCIAFAGAIASENFSHGGSHARAGARAKRLDADADSASEFDILVRSMNRIADETSIAAKRHADNNARLRRLERAWALLSACWQSQLRAQDEKELLAAVCAHLCEHGGYRAAWVGYARQDEKFSVEVAAHGGTDANYVHKLALSWGEEVHEQGGFGTAIHQNRTMTTNQLVTDLVFNAADRPAVPHGLLAAAALPLRTDPESAPFGVLGIYSVHAESFDDEELKLLQTLADDLVLGIGRTKLHAQCVAVAAAAEAEAEERAAHPVYFDDLTGLATLATLQRKVAPLAAQAAAAHRKLGALHVNLDSFDMINEKLGREVADQVLVQAALRLAQAAGEKAVLARPGADEFIVLLPCLVSAAHAGKIAARVAAALAQPVDASLLPPDTPLLKLMCSTGIGLYPDDTGDGDDGGPLLAHAAEAMQQAKQQGGNTYRYYATALNAQVAQRGAMELELGRALERRELLLYYQPQASLAHGGVTCAEAMLRWQHPQRGVLAPQDFIRQAEETGLVLPFGAWAIERACRQLKEWADQGLHMPPVAVNLSASQFSLPGLADTVRHALESSGVPAASLVLEVGEQGLMHNPDAAAATLRQLKELGVGLVLDDFGSSQASLYCLKEFPFDRLKLDPALVHELGVSPGAAVLCGAIVSMAHTLGGKVLADGVETEAQLHSLQQRHCDAVQGALFSKALPAEGYAALLASGKKLPVTAKATQAPEPSAVTHTLLLVDAEAATLRALNRVLKGDGSKILAASSGADALALLEINPVQAVVCGERLSDMSGVDFLAQAAEQRPGAERILLTGDDSYAAALDALNSGAARRIFPKPWSDAQLRDCVYQPLLQV
ncbi:EAL domain-containing protein [Pseudoduganella aquatica]|uniref:EAL domain-containing protein n=1 Tax=Pseudoduganella aquatica TaxID=2660641 RepID=A0A7X4H927_9BURK|nr:EAL domain-containing protein [Pseudoduganella aquatica]MYN06918.1 EAL domain-containing protein [Pseudoduganella aquatica]